MLFCAIEKLRNISLSNLKGEIKLVKGYATDVNKYLREREDSSASEDERDRDSVVFVVGDDFPNGGAATTTAVQSSAPPTSLNSLAPMSTSTSTLRATVSFPPLLMHQGNSVER